MNTSISVKGKGKLSDAYLDELVPTSGDDDRVLGVGAEEDAGDPVGVALVGDGELAVTEGVPELDAAVTRSGDNLAVVGGEGDGEDVVGVANEGTGGLAGSELPEAERLVPGVIQSVGTVGGDHLLNSQNPHVSRTSFRTKSPAISTVFGRVRYAYTVRDDVRVTLEAALGVTVGLLVAGKVPDDQGLVATAREQHVGARVGKRIKSETILSRINQPMPFLEFLHH